MNHLKISQLEFEDIMNLNSLQPEGWNDIRKVFYTHIGKPYFEAFKGKLAGDLVVVGHIMYCRDSAWLGNIIVSKSKRNKGIGSSVTQYLIDQIIQQGFEKIYLLATELGRSIYYNLGFKEASSFSFVKFKSSDIHLDKSWIIRRILDSDFPYIINLDMQATGEDRSAILKYFLVDGWIILRQKSVIEGFYLPNLGDGLIIANNEAAGIELSKFRFQGGKDYVVVPNSNTDFIKKTGITYEIQERIAYYMYRVMWKIWKPNMIYSRIGGYLG